MKRIAFLIVLGGLAVGCGESKEQKEIAGLQARLTVDEQRLKNTTEVAERADTNSVILISDVGDARLVDSELNGLCSNLNEQVFDLDMRVISLQSWHDAVFATHQIAPAPAATPETEQTAGIPTDVYNQIRSAAEQEWPGDYEMQQFKINEQVAAWKNLNR